MPEPAEITEVEATVAGVPFKLKGWGGILLAIIAALGLGLALMVNFSITQWGTPFPIQLTVKANHDETITEIRKYATQWTGEHNALSDNIEALTYVISVCTKPEKSRECPNLQMPESLRKKIRKPHAEE